jgi:hypothetical protein
LEMCVLKCGVFLNAPVRSKLELWLLPAAFNCAPHECAAFASGLLPEFLPAMCNAHFREAVYSVLLVVVAAPAPGQSSILPYATRCFSAGLNDASAKVNPILLLQEALRTDTQVLWHRCRWLRCVSVLWCTASR